MFQSVQINRDMFLCSVSMDPRHIFFVLYMFFIQENHFFA